jgi:antitoxin HigA-1
MSGSRIIIDKDDLLDNVHPGEILREDFLIGGEVPIGEVAVSTGIDEKQLQKLLDSQISVTADLDLRLGRYFGMSEGFFLRLQNCFDLEEERRAHGAELDLIAQRAA